MSAETIKDNPLLKLWLTVFGAETPYTGYGRMMSSYNETSHTFDYHPIDITQLPDDIWASERGRSMREAIERLSASEEKSGLGDMYLVSAAVREFARDAYSWATPTDRALTAIVERGPIVEIGAGTGYWAALLADRGADVVAYDIQPPPNFWHRGENQWFDLRTGSAELAGKHPDRTLFLCWPPYADRMATDALKAHMRAGGERLVYVGEGEGGCTGGYMFHRLVERFYVADAEIAIPQWEGLHDYLTCYTRKVRP